MSAGVIIFIIQEVRILLMLADIATYKTIKKKNTTDFL